jgi:hypothetical protein
MPTPETPYSSKVKLRASPACTYSAVSRLVLKQRSGMPLNLSEKGAIAKPPRLSGAELTFLELIQSPTRFAVTVRSLGF